MGLVKLDTKTSIKLVFLILILTVIVLVGIKAAPWLIEHGKNPEYIRTYLADFGNAGFLVYILIHIIHAIIVIVPGDIINICGGFIYGIPLGFTLSFIGIMLGSVIVFYISRFFGYEFVSRLVAKEKIEKMSGMLNSSKGTVGLFIFWCIPFIPKDLMMYIAGLTPIKASRLFLVFGFARIPSTLLWVSIGANTYEKDYWGLGITIFIMLILMVIVFIVGRYYRKKEKLNNENK